MKEFFKRINAVILAAVLTCCFIKADASGGDISTEAEAPSASVEYSYSEYLKQYETAADAAENVNIELSDFVYANSTAVIKELDGKNALVTDENDTVNFTVKIPSDGMYGLVIEYYPISGKGSSIVRNLKIDGDYPYNEAKNIMFSRYIVNETDEFARDDSGNEIRPSQIEAPRWLKTEIYDGLGYYSEPLKFYLTAGTHSLSIESVREPLALGAVTFAAVAEVPSYEQLKNNGGFNGEDNPKEVYIKLQGEHASAKSDTMLYPESNTSSAAVEPSSYKNTLLNIIGGSKWETCGQWIEWEAEIPYDGYYKLAFKVRQNTEAGQPSYRRLTIDGELPAAEFAALKFPYDTQWQTVTAGGDDPYLIYLSKGRHILRLECVLGELSELVQQIDASITVLNRVYRSFLMIIGQNSDTDRDYDFEKLLPDEFETLKEQSKILETVYNRYMEISGIGGSQAETVNTMVKQLKLLCRDPDSVAKQFSDFSTNISSLGTWLTTALSQPLTIDYIVIASPEQEIESANGGFLKNFSFGFMQFIYSFSTDYSSVGVASGDTESQIKVWIGSGRDQANVLQRLITNDFTAKSGIGVNMQLVASGTVLMATLAGKGPDIALSLSQTDLMNYAFRGAIYDISVFTDYKEMTERFQKSAVAPLSFNGKSYGLPETQSFYMMFYREDILSDLKLEVPETWADVTALLPVLQKNNMNFGMPAAVSTAATGVGTPVFAMLYYQRGGEFYNSDGSECLLDSDSALDVFDQWTKFYTDYGFNLDYNFLTQFRSGTIPIGIADYGTYNSLSVFAPELNGVWNFTTVPGIEKENGEIDRTVTGTVTAAAIMSSTAYPEEAWEFLKWWTSSEAQTAYGRELESIMGSAARYQTANKEAFYQLPWSAKEFTVLMEQWNQTRETPEVPGSYMTVRYLDFAFKQVVMSGAADPAKVLIAQNVQINAEIASKREEFGL